MLGIIIQGLERQRRFFQGKYGQKFRKKYFIHALKNYSVKGSAMRIIFVLLFSALSVLPVFGMDSSSSDSAQAVTTARNSEGVPIGTVLAWPVAANPDDNWLECNGQSVNRSVYPELFAVIGSTVPDYRGLFLRGLGGQSAKINILQKHSTYIAPKKTSVVMRGALRQIAGRWISWESGGYSITSSGYYGFITGAFWPSIPKPAGGGMVWIGQQAGENPMMFVNNGVMTSPIPISITGGIETRPDNKAVRYFIRARS